MKKEKAPTSDKPISLPLGDLKARLPVLCQQKQLKVRSAMSLSKNKNLVQVLDTGDLEGIKGGIPEVMDCAHFPASFYGRLRSTGQGISWRMKRGLLHVSDGELCVRGRLFREERIQSLRVQVSVQSGVGV